MTGNPVMAHHGAARLIRPERGWQCGGDWSGSENESAEPTVSQEEDDQPTGEEDHGWIGKFLLPPKPLAFSTWSGHHWSGSEML